jgi:hypothetical protein
VPPQRGRASPVVAVALLVLAAHVATNLVSAYGLNSDELLYLAMGEHLRFFAMDFPPAIAILAAGERTLFGDAIWAIRLAPALAHAALVPLAAAAARAGGGGRSAQLLAALAVATTPLHLRVGAMFQPVVLDQLWWSLALYALLRLSLTPDAPAAPRWWLILGAAMGLGLLTKFSILFLGLGVVTALLVTSLRRRLATPWPWLALLLALAMGAPSVAGQVRLGWPVVSQMADLRARQLVLVSMRGYLGEQVAYGPIAALAAAGLIWSWRRARAVTVACTVPFVVLLLLHGKGYYIGPIYPVLSGLGAASVAAPGRLSPARRRAAALAAALFALVALPMGLPLLPPGPMARYVALLRVGGTTSSMAGVVMPLPQDYADMLGWEEMARQAAVVYHSLPLAERAHTVLLASNYGEAGALDFYGRRYGLPRARCAIGSYWYYGPGPSPADAAVTVGLSAADVALLFRDARLARTVVTPLALATERVVPIAVARGPYRPLHEVWPELAGRH